jgi:L-cysteine desulfidase
MNILKEVLKKQVYPAFGCTEPVSVALCAATAAKALGKPPDKMQFFLDAATYKNGMAVNIPNTNGEKGNLLAGVMGALLARPELEMQLLSAATPSVVLKAKALIAKGGAGISVEQKALPGIFIRAVINSGKSRVVCEISGTHTHVSLLELNGRRLVYAPVAASGENKKLERLLAKQTLKALVEMAEAADAADLEYIAKGVEMNLAAADAGLRLKKVGSCLVSLKKRGYLIDDVFASSKILVACAADARMDGLPLPVMSSGESGNQGIVAILVPYNAGKTFKIKEEKIYRSIALSHLLNAYVKVFTGSLSPMCGCAIGAGIGATAAIVYQRAGTDIKAISLAINNLISDLGGMLCDGAKSGCALKVVSSADSSIRSAHMATCGYGITEAEGFIGRTAEESIQNLAYISNIGMGKVDSTILHIMHGKAARMNPGQRIKPAGAKGK